MILIPGSLMKLEKGTGEFLKDWFLLELKHDRKHRGQHKH